ncbi:HDOD domain-containing protein [Ningiella sp. W23]|uniref:HDOD domain-containing protein n=1 Tax=Ningiella sp. W23 TaxID=3023715 RepID=UPI0037572298
METTSILIPIAIVLMVGLLLWRMKASGQKKDYSNTLLKVRQKRQGSIYKEPQSPDEIVKASMPTGPANPQPAQQPMDKPEAPEELAELKLLSYAEFRSQDNAQQDFQSLRKPHPLLMSLSKSITDAQELIRIVKSDPELVAMVLNMANSPFFGLKKAITDINHAVIYLGIAQVKNLATQFAISQSFEFNTDKQRLAYEKIWQTSFFASAMALFIAREANLENPSELSTRCLLSYLGDITLLSLDPQVANFYLGNMPLHQRIKGMQSSQNANSAVVGGVFAEHLQLPKELHEGIGLGYQPLLDDWEACDISEEEKRDILFCYSISRVAEYFILEADDTFGQAPSLNYVKTFKTEFYYLIEQLEECGLDHLDSVLCNVRTKIKLSQMLGDLRKSMKDKNK